jgi:hypothetical protein
MQPADSATSASANSASANSAIDRMFFEHPRDINESYGEHAGHALYIGCRLIVTGLACLVHAVIPGVFVRTASNTVDYINSLMAQRTRRAGQSASTIQSATMMENPSN